MAQAPFVILNRLIRPCGHPFSQVGYDSFLERKLQVCASSPKRMSISRRIKGMGRVSESCVELLSKCTHFFSRQKKSERFDLLGD